MPRRRASPATIQLLYRVGLGIGFTESHQARARGDILRATGYGALLSYGQCGQKLQLARSED